MNDTAFPDAGNVDVYKYANAFDYSRYDEAQMSLQLCTVPWDVGEVRVGQSIIPGLGNVVYFDTTEKRDKYFADMPDTECFRFETKFKELHRESKIDVAVPFDVASKFNYLVVKYNLFANDDSPVMYEDANGLREWFYFIREVEFIAPNTTKLHLILDAWQTFIYDLNITGMILERGHAPMAGLSAATYLTNPIGNASKLLAPDTVNDNAYYMGGTSGELIFNGGETVYAVFVTSANMAGVWGTKAAGTWQTPAIPNNTEDGNLTFSAFCIAASDLTTFLQRLNSSQPQFFQTVKAVFFIGSEFITRGTGFTFSSTQCYKLSTTYKTSTLLTLTKNSFGYPTDYADIAKLYTWPYAYIELTDGNGNDTIVRIEETNGKINFASRLNLVMPFLRISGHISSTGKGTSKAVTFKNINSQSLSIKGNWYKLLMDFEIPTFGVVLSAGKEFDYSTDFNRRQSKIAADATYDSTMWSAENSKESAYASADVTKINTDASALAAKLNANDSAALAITNANAQKAANTANNAADKTRITDDVQNDNIAAAATALAANTVINGTTNNQIAATDKRAALAASSAVVTGAVSAVSSALTGNIAGAVGAAVGAGTSAANAMMNADIANDLSSADAALHTANNTSMRDLTQALNTGKLNHQTTQMDAALLNANDLTDALAANSAATANGNALRSYETITGDGTDIGTSQRDKDLAEANADRNYNIVAGENNVDIGNAQRSKDTAYSAIDNQIDQAALGAPFEYGLISNAEHASTRPVGLFAEVVTQDAYSIAYAGNEFLRYGYRYDSQWPFDGDWNVCPKFTYWKLKDIWTRNINIPDMYVDRIRFLLLGGVTVWSDPEYIGNTTIYDNIVWS